MNDSANKPVRMSKKESHAQELTQLLEGFFEDGNADELMAYIASNSALPGPRGNLELAEAFGDMAEQYALERVEKLWALFATMTEVSAEEAPVNDPRELIPFCGTVGIGAIGAASPALFAAAMPALRKQANDPRWRMREAVSMGLQRLIARHPQEALDVLEQWASSGSLLEMRAAAAGVAEPALLRNDETARAALALHKAIFDRVLEIEDRKSDAFKALRKGLGYTLSLVVRALPKEGFAFMRQLVATQDKDVLWIVKENLKKNRLVRHFPEEVESVTASL
jgi:hypothetical protein